MLNVTNKTAAIALIAFAMMSCSDDGDKEAAQQLVADITTLIEDGDIEQAMALMDTVNIKYPTQIEARQQVSALKPRAIELAVLRQISTADSLIAAAQIEINQLEPQLKHIVPNDHLEGYYVVSRGYDPRFIEKTAIEARINDKDYNFYLVAQNKGKKIGLNQLALYTPVSQENSQVIPGTSARLMKFDDSEMASFLPEEVYALGEWAYANRDDVKGAMMLGSGGHSKLNLTDSQAKSIGIAWRYAQQRQLLRSALIQREKLERQLQQARDQQANHPLETINPQ